MYIKYFRLRFFILSLWRIREINKCFRRENRGVNTMSPEEKKEISRLVKIINNSSDSVVIAVAGKKLIDKSRKVRENYQRTKIENGKEK